MSERKVDEHGRPLYRDSEVPPCHPCSKVDCIDGWVRSGDWWLHCGVCRPYEDES